MKRIFITVLTALLVLSLCACNETNPSSDASSLNSEIESLKEQIDKLKEQLEGSENESSVSGSSENSESESSEPENTESLPEDNSASIELPDMSEIVEIMQVNGGHTLVITEDKEDFHRELKMYYADGTSELIFSNSYIHIAVASPDGSMVIYNDFEWEVSSKVYLYDAASRTSKELSMKSLPENHTASYMDWFDSRYFMLVSQFDHGTVAVGGDVFIYDTKTDECRKLIGRADDRIQIVSFERNGDSIVLKVAKYDESYANAEYYFYNVSVSEINGLISNGGSIDIDITE